MQHPTYRYSSALFVFTLLFALSVPASFAEAQTTSSQTPQPTCLIQKNLTLGSKGSEVTCLQTYLRQKGYLTTEPSGYFGPATKKAVIKWQSWNGLPDTGYFGGLSRGLFNVS